MTVFQKVGWKVCPEGKRKLESLSYSSLSKSYKLRKRSKFSTVMSYFCFNRLDYCATLSNAYKDWLVTVFHSFGSLLFWGGDLPPKINTHTDSYSYLRMCGLNLAYF